MNLLVLPSSNQNTYLPKKRKNDSTETEGSQLEMLETVTSRINLKEAVKLPPYVDLNEWLAHHTLDFCNQMNSLYLPLDEYCTPTTCPLMNAGSKYEYRWADGDTVKVPIAVSAPKYVEYLQDWIEKQTETIFPQEYGGPFPPEFKDGVKQILKKVFRVYAHIYHSHFSTFVSLRLEAHLNTCFKHLLLFIIEHQLINKAELAPLKDLVEKFQEP